MPLEYTDMSYEETLRTHILNIHFRLKKILLFLTISSIFTAMSGFFVTIVCYKFFQGLVDFQICFAVFLMAFSVYSLNKISDIDEDAINMPERVNFVGNHKKLVIYYSIASYTFSLYLAYINNPQSTLVLLVPIVANVLYSSHIFQGVPRLKDIPLMKNVVTAVSWSTVATLLPALSLMKKQDISSPSIELLPGIQIPLVVLVIFYFVFIKGFINTVLYDVRDVDGDIISGTKTIPVILGTQKTCFLLLGVNCMLLPCLTLMSGSIRIFMTMFIIYGYASILYFRERRDPLYLDLFVEGEWMNLYLLFLFLKSLGLLS